MKKARKRRNLKACGAAEEPKQAGILTEPGANVVPLPYSKRAQTRSVGLEQLPIEILQHIIHLLVTLCCPCSECAQSQLQFSQRTNPFAFTKLQSPVSLVSKALCRVARPIAFGTVYLLDYRRMKKFSKVLSEAPDSGDVGRGLGVEARWVRKLVVYMVEGPKLANSLRKLTKIFTRCTNVQTIMLLNENPFYGFASTLDLQRLTSLWKAMPNSLQNIYISDTSFIPIMASSDEKDFIDTHREISLASFGSRFSTSDKQSQACHLFPRLSRLRGCVLSSSQMQENRNVNWSSLTWLRQGSVGMFDREPGAFQPLRLDSLVSLELGRDVYFDSFHASWMFSGAPNLEELHYEVLMDFDDLPLYVSKVGWGKYDKVSKLPVKHQTLKLIEVIFCIDLPDGEEHRERKIVTSNVKRCCVEDFRGLTAKNFGSLGSLDVFIELHYTEESEVIEVLREKLEVAIREVVNPNIRLRILFKDTFECEDYTHF